MEKRDLKSNYIFSLVNLVLFLVVFCFVFEYTAALIKSLRANETFHISIAYCGAAFPLILYVFIADLNSVYEKSQFFFFRGTLLNLVLPSILLLLTAGYFLIPRLLGVGFDRNLYLFLGAAAFSVHLIFVANNSKSPSFTGFINYIFVLTMIYLVCLILLGVYLEIGFRVHMGRVLITTLKEGTRLLKSLFTQITP
jgi:hypothetical protein